MSVTPLSRAYPFLALAFALTPATWLASFLPNRCERLVIGIVLIWCGFSSGGGAIVAQASRVCVVIAAYNEASVIASVVADVKKRWISRPSSS